MKHPYLILAIILMITLLLIFDRLELRTRRMRDRAEKGEPSDGMLPKDKVANDKLIVVEGGHEDLIKRIIRDFCGWHNREMLQVIPVVTKITDQQFAIIFPYDVSFDIFCSFINYLNYPKGYGRRFYAIGWTTTRLTDMWITAESAGKQVFLFVSDADREYDYVFMTTIDQLGYQLNFSIEKAQLLEHTAKTYHMPPFTTGDLAGSETVAVSFSEN
ncbi:hypothetical protein LL912_25040 [Niabella sp. CC-SYL272]|uniref:hypothetical protein n=1 Tax=Niabella agricola TaxID=2891571 RepID=UPI001F16AAA1|nr:hypothetical protein [Niabella agricola]MCF3112078.1 hypothetical protein [Niabella agricola]